MVDCGSRGRARDILGTPSVITMKLTGLSVEMFPKSCLGCADSSLRIYVDNKSSSLSPMGVGPFGWTLLNNAFTSAEFYDARQYCIELSEWI